jgi:hypothetical protein
MKWHPKQYHPVAVASENDIYVLNIFDAARYFDGEPIIQSDLHALSSLSVSYKLFPLRV